MNESTETIKNIKPDFKDSKYATGRRKTSIAKVWLKKGTGKIFVNGKNYEKYFTRDTHKMQIRKPFEIIDDNISTTIKLLQFYKNKHLKKFISAGSSEIYAGLQNQNKTSINHTEQQKIIFSDIKNPRWSYATSKFLSEIAVINSGIPYIIIRYFNVYGPKQKDHFIPEFVERVKRKKFKVFGGKNTRSFIFVKDAVDASIKLSTKKIKNEIFNLGSNKEIKIIDVAKLILNILNIKEKKIKILSAPHGSVLRRKPSIKKLEKVIGNFNKTSLKKGLKQTLGIKL